MFGFKKTRLSFLTLLLLFGGSARVFATHQKAAEIIIEHVSGYTYKAKLYTYTYSLSPADRPELTIFWGDGTFDDLVRSRLTSIGNETNLNYYEGTHTYSGPGTYVLYMEDANRNGGVVNVPNSIMTPMFVSSTLVISPWLGTGNSGPVTTVRPVADNACLGQPYIHNPGAYDPDGDMLTYRLIPCRTSDGEDVPGYTYPSADKEFYIDTYSGNLVWDAPVRLGEYNVAILIEEWRNQMKIGDVTRDMQIVVQACDNTAPHIETESEMCIRAGDTLSFVVKVFDNDGDAVALSFSGELTDNDFAEVRRFDRNGDTVFYRFTWRTRLQDSRLHDYQIYFRAEDNGSPSLSTTRTVSVRVVAPALRFTRAEAARQSIDLSWTPTRSPHAYRYSLYRRDVSEEEAEYESCRTGVPDTNYVLLAQVGTADTAYRDSTVSEGRSYCYRIVADFPDGDQSLSSERICAEPRNFSPLITKVSVEATDVYKGVNAVCWRRPAETDSMDMAFGRYRLYRAVNPDSMEFVADFPLDSAVCFLDSALNTERIRYFYRVTVDSGASEKVSSVYLTASGLPGRVRLKWVYSQPWRQTRFDIYRYNDSGSTFGLVASVSGNEREYTDKGLEIEKTYRYYVEAVGSYASERLPDELHNRSNEASATVSPYDPCKPYLFLFQANCNPLRNILVWDYDSLYNPFAPLTQTSDGIGAEEKNECETAAAYYEVYRRCSDKGNYDWIATVQERRYEDDDPGSLYCTYRVRAFTEHDEAGEISGELTVDNWSCLVFDVPNVFTPNNDGINDKWHAKDPSYIEDFEIRVVNRWGVEVFRSKDPYFEWDGTLFNKGEACPDGAYFYYAEIRSYIQGKKRERTQSGSVTVLR